MELQLHVHAGPAGSSCAASAALKTRRPRWLRGPRGVRDPRRAQRGAGTADLCGGRCAGWQVPTARQRLSIAWQADVLGQNARVEMGRADFNRKRAVPPLPREERARAGAEGSAYIMAIQSRGRATRQTCKRSARPPVRERPPPPPSRPGAPGLRRACSQRANLSRVQRLGRDSRTISSSTVGLACAP